jgi:hypothetical protein
MHRWLFLLGLFPLSLAGCYHDEMHRSDWGGRCDIGVAFQLSSLQDLLDKHEPTTVRVCFDRSCDELTLRGRQGQYWCEGAPGGPPDQLTWCDFQNGRVTVAILRVDGQDYGNNAPHTAAISIRDGKAQRIFSHAEVIRFSESSCGFKKIRLSPPAPERADSTPPPPPPPASAERPADEPSPADEPPADPPPDDPPDDPPEDPETDPSDPADPPPSDG